MQIESLFPEVAQLVPEAPELLVKTKTIAALQRFYRESKVWTGDATVLLPAGVGELVVAAPAGANQYEVSGVRSQSSGLPLTETRESAMNGISRTWRVDAGQEPVRYVPNIDPSRVAFWPIPSADFGLIVTHVLYPSASAVEYHDWVDGKYREQIVSGIAGMLKRMPKKPWQDINEATLRDDEFQSAISQARLGVSREGARGITMARTTGFEEL